MKRFFAIVAFLCSVALSSCGKDEEVADTRAFAFSATIPSIPSTGVSVSGASHTFFVKVDFDWDIYHGYDGYSLTRSSYSDFIVPEYTLHYDGYSVTRYDDQITVDIDALGLLQYRNIVIKFVSTDGLISREWSAKQYGVGEGSAAIPYFLSTASHLESIAAAVNSKTNDSAGIYYQMICDIDLGGSDSNKWTTIGKRDAPFMGHFDGGGNEISGLYIDASGVGYQGLFGYIGAGSSISNLGVSGIVRVNSLIIEEPEPDPDAPVTRADGSGANYNIGGIVGYSNDGDIINCYNRCEVHCWGDTSGKFGENVGGIVGYNYGGVIKNCYNTGAITGINNFVGGITGWNKGLIENSYNVGYITATSVLVGGIAGGTAGSSSINNCYSLVGSVIEGGPDVEIAPDGTVAGIDGTVKSESYMRSAPFVVDLASSIWGMDSISSPVNGGYPIFNWQR